jgi:hypothetical protein
MTTVRALAIDEDAVERHYRGMHPVFLSDGKWRLELGKAGADVFSNGKRNAYTVQHVRVKRGEAEPLSDGEFVIGYRRKREAVNQLMSAIVRRGWKAELPDGSPLTRESLLAFCKERNPFLGKL